MNGSTTRLPAEERLLDAALHQVMSERRTGAPASRASHWLLAAIVLLGVAVTAFSMWHARTPPSDEAQEPAPMPPEVGGDGKAQIELLPAGTENLQAKFTDPRDLRCVARFERLRRLRLWPQELKVLGFETDSHHGRWRAPPADLLAPLAKLAHLEVLGLPHELALTPELLAPLAGHPSLREIQFVRDAFTIDEKLVAALAKIPHLRALHLRFVPVGRETLRALAKLPLTSLELEFCHDLDAEGWQALLTMRTLRRLAFSDWSWNTVPGRADTQPGWRPTPDDLRLLHQLPELRCLELLSCDIDDEQFAALPDTLTTLHVLGSKLTPEGFAKLSRFVQLRELAINSRPKPKSNTIADLFAADSEPRADAIATALQPLRLRKLRYAGALTEALAQAIKSQTELRDVEITSKQAAPNAATLFGRLPVQRVVWRAPVDADLLEALANRPDLRELELSANDITDVAALAKAPVLERLTLTETTVGNGIAASVLAPLAEAPALRELFVNVSVVRGEARASEADLQRAVSERIKIHLHESEFTVKR